ncbi:unnamed protein product [Withania somnifera]
MASSQRSSKKRVVLGEIQNISNVGKGLEGEPQKPKSKKQSRRKVKRAIEEKELNVEDVDDPQMCSTYIEEKRRPLPDYLENVQKDVSATMRGILVDWLVEISEEYKLLSDTLYLTVSYLDRFLSMNVIARQKLQLLGVSSMLIAAILDYSCVKFLPSLVAAIVVFLSRFTLQPNSHPWSAALQQYSGYKAVDLKDCVLILHDLQLSIRGGFLVAFKCVSMLTCPMEIPASFFEDTRQS